ncbi:PREDICTED: myosin regulatory light chain 2, atrial isoform-like, partial [Leptosomus discolor]|uniref:myosin regulatory light chain 2, atrial isoform-like n=1 Tax=Leptosomus discolor TaxID=188344 RepID=UPI000522B1E4
DPKESVLNTFKLFGPTSTVNKDKFKQLLLTQAGKFSPGEVRQLPWLSLSPSLDPAHPVPSCRVVNGDGNIDYKSLCYIITHGDKKDD